MNRLIGSFLAFYSALGLWLMGQGLWLMTQAHDSWLMAHGSRNKKIAAGSPRPWALAANFLLAMSHEP